MTSSVIGLIARKRDGGELAHEEFAWLIEAYLAGEADDAQMAAFLMAGVLRGFSDDEAIALTDALVASGDRIDLSTLTGPTVDKHSTGGVADTATLVVAPMLAASGCQVAKLSGRGLGHTGGTIDKLEAVPGFGVDLTPDQLRRQVERIGLAVAAAGPDLAPADRRLYALRDVTATVADPALIASSVMSKKIAGGAAHVLLDVKVGTGAFLPEEASARRLAQRCVAIGEAAGRRTAALLTRMDEPLGPAVGNALEVAAAIEVLQGRDRGPLRQLSASLTVHGLRLTGVPEEEARRRASTVLDSGAALERFREFISHQDGDPAVADTPWSVLPVAPVVRRWHAAPGWITGIDARQLGLIAGALGASRTRAGEAVDPAVGLQLHVRVGDRVDAAHPAAVIHARTEAGADEAERALGRAVAVGPEPVSAGPLVLGTVGFGDGVDREQLLPPRSPRA